MSANEYVCTTIDQNVMDEATAVLANFGMSVSDACRMLLTEIADSKHLPYSMEIPNKETQEVIEAAERGEGICHAKDIDDLFRQLGI